MKSEHGFHKAVYRESPIKAFQGNPLIEALPPIASDEALIKVLAYVPSVDEGVKGLRPEIRRASLVDLESFTYPFSEYLEFARRIESAIYRGYSSKNPCLPTSNHYLYYLDSDETPVQPITGRFESRPTGIAIVGPSGSGKNWMFERVLNLYPQVIVHDKYNGKLLPVQQIVWLKMSCPEDGSLVTFVARFLSAIDEVLGTEYYDEAMGKRLNKGVLATMVERLSRLYRIGVIVIDEFSNLKIPKRATASNVPTVHRLILNLMNGSGVPIVFCGNPEMLDIMQLTLKTARRAENGGVITMGSMHPKVWSAMSKRLWKLQVTNEVTPWGQENADILYQASRGLVEIAVRGFFEAQRLVIGTDDERLTGIAIRTGVAQAIELSNKTLDYSINQNIHDGNWVPNQGVDSCNISVPEYDKLKASVTENKTTRERKLYDPQRPQHPEFYDALNKMRYDSCLIPDKCNPTLLREAYQQDTAIQWLIDNRVILEDIVTLNI